MKLLILFVILSIGLFQYGQSQVSKEPQGSLNFLKSVKTFIGRFNSIAGTGSNIQFVFDRIFADDSEAAQAIRRDLDTIKTKLERMDTYISFKLQNMEDILINLEKGPDIRAMKSQLAVGIQTVDEAWNTLSIYRRNLRATSRPILQSYVDTYFQKLTDFLEIQKRIAPTQNVAGFGVESLPVLLAKDITTNLKKICGTRAGAQQYLMSLLIIILNAEVRTTILLTLIGKLKFRDQFGWSTYQTNLEANFVTRYEAYIREFSKGFDLAPREYRSCDPAEGWVKGVSYFELDRFNQATIFRAPSNWAWPKRQECDQRAEIMSQDGDRKICQTKTQSGDCYETREEVCHGTLTTCSDVRKPERCVLRGETRRYQWIKANDGADVWGRVQDGCRSGVVVPADWRPYCICHCIEGFNGVSLEMAASNLHQKKVITAVRFAKKNNIIFIQIKEGKLAPEGKISETSNEWKPASPSTDPKKFVTFDSIDNSFNVGNVVGAHNEVLAGVQFIRSEENSGKRLKLQIYVIKFKYSTGELLGRKHYISSSEISNDNHVIGDLNSISAINKVDHVEDSLPGHYERFYRTPLTADAGQATVPLFDATPVESKPVRPLSGVGLFHRGAPKYAGFLSLKAIDVDTSFFFRKYYLNKLNDVAIDEDM